MIILNEHGVPVPVTPVAVDRGTLYRDLRTRKAIFVENSAMDNVAEALGTGFIAALLTYAAFKVTSAALN